jgi:hypothetical protein
MKKIILVSTMLYFVFLYSCKETLHNTISLRNNSDTNMVTVIVHNADIFTCLNNAYKIQDKYTLLSSKYTDNSTLLLSDDNWENRLKTNTLKVFFIHPDVYNNSTCDVFKTKKRYVERSVTLDYLNQNNWTVSYP